MDIGIDIPLIIGDLVIILKGFYLLGLLLYLFFAALVIRQAQMMSRSLSGVLFLPVRTLAWLHLLATLVVLFLAIFLL